METYFHFQQWNGAITKLQIMHILYTPVGLNDFQWVTTRTPSKILISHYRFWPTHTDTHTHIHAHAFPGAVGFPHTERAIKTENAALRDGGVRFESRCSTPFHENWKWEVTVPSLCLLQSQNPMLKLIRNSIIFMGVFTFCWACRGNRLLAVPATFSDTRF